MSDTIYTWPNLITITRVFAVLPVIWLVHNGSAVGQSHFLWIALCLMLACEFSDWLDGYLARRMKWVSSSGKVLDPMADSLYRISVFAAIVANGWMPLWMLLIMAARDLGMSEVRLLAQRSQITLAARSSGKFKAAIQGVAQFVIVLMYAIGGKHFRVYGVCDQCSIVFGDGRDAVVHYRLCARGHCGAEADDARAAASAAVIRRHRIRTRGPVGGLA